MQCFYFEEEALVIRQLVDTRACHDLCSSCDIFDFYGCIEDILKDNAVIIIGILFDAFVHWLISFNGEVGYMSLVARLTVWKESKLL